MVSFTTAFWPGKCLWLGENHLTHTESCPEQQMKIYKYVESQTMGGKNKPWSNTLVQFVFCESRSKANTWGDPKTVLFKLIMGYFASGQIGPPPIEIYFRWHQNRINKAFKVYLVLVWIFRCFIFFNHFISLLFLVLWVKISHYMIKRQCVGCVVSYDD